ncbi:hypothetical protein ABT336_01600 [Micromonospora sp. NPDC000207]|uniref:hypothetical protein n=1 Tax=Micromonospora sp. NPDC000207 TaxID=3154246 RepID=UPI003331B203
MAYNSQEQALTYLEVAEKFEERASGRLNELAGKTGPIPNERFERRTPLNYQQDALKQMSSAATMQEQAMRQLTEAAKAQRGIDIRRSLAIENLEKEQEKALTRLLHQADKQIDVRTALSSRGETAILPKLAELQTNCRTGVNKMAAFQKDLNTSLGTFTGKLRVEPELPLAPHAITADEALAPQPLPSGSPPLPPHARTTSKADYTYAVATMQGPGHPGSRQGTPPPPETATSPVIPVAGNQFHKPSRQPSQQR